MKALQRTLAIVASLFLLVQTVRHTYVLWLEPRTSVLDKYDRPLKDEIAAAPSMEALLARYDPVRREVDRVKAERRLADPKAHFPDQDEEEPFKSEKALREGISSWEERANEIHGLRFYASVGVFLIFVGLMVYGRVNRWLGVTLLIVGFSELIYWTCPSFLSATTAEFDRLLINKLAMSLVSLVLLGAAILRLKTFQEGTRDIA